MLAAMAEAGIAEGDEDEVRRITSPVTPSVTPAALKPFSAVKPRYGRTCANVSRACALPVIVPSIYRRRLVYATLSTSCPLRWEPLSTSLCVTASHFGVG